jgi:hypothetical protein
MKKKDGPEKASAMSCEKCECCKVKTRGDHSVTDGTAPKVNEKLQTDAKRCDCPCCSPKDPNKSKTEVITLALMNY